MSTPTWDGVVPMTRSRYLYLADLAGDNLLVSRPIAHNVNMPYDGDEEKAVYVVANRDGLACYAGQTRPSRSWTGAAGIRLKQHLAERSKRDEWDTFWVLPLKWSTKPAIIDWYERTVATRLMLPLRHHRGGTVI
ncbi:hypothetical protein KDK95_00825 [Actinospica sp. MGRD01-02]|uniref:GIY-YIG domain-containing protein n=1 Tax=Actinospica acidithermotolerans TaxID=2828514 RepID=A0A941IGN2_9ACTN|nr:hypothetical protein [Actinospica acidithermotolerans]MBR7824832.1 hypothetical protein [Actinospica acidithermotolerans]